MEEEGSVKAPVTRLRRRLSVDQLDDTKSPSAPSTPTKKRGRLAAKPQLELIDENVPQNSPRRTTRKSMARDVVDEEKPLTPGRRSTRVKSNTSTVSETPQDDERSQTPSRRSTRIKSNTSIISETINVDSPRAIRAAARRNSQLGSDTETTLTPTRPRRNRKDSTSSIDKQESAVTPLRTRQTRKESLTTDKEVDAVPSKSTSLITLVISEVPETNTEQSTSKASLDNINRETSSQTNLRKSPRLKAKSNRSQSERDDSNDRKPENHENIQEVNQDTDSETQALFGVSDGKLMLSQLSNNFIIQLESDSKRNDLSHLNKSTSVIKDTDNSKTKRHRTKSWTTLSASPSSDSNFHSDNESAKNKFKKHEKKFCQFPVGSGDSVHNKSNTEEIRPDNNDIRFINTLSKQTKILDKEADTGNKQIIEDSVTPDNSIKQNESLCDKSKPTDSINEGDKEKVLDANTDSKNSSATEILFDKSPGEIKALVFIEDSDSNSESNEKKAKEPILEGDDQCVPVVYRAACHESESRSCEIISQVNIQEFGTLNNPQENTRVDDSCEPMEVDVTIPENVSIIDSKKTIEQQLCNETSVKETEEFTTANTSLDKSKRKSSSQFFTQDLEKSSNENKSTLILSQIKDVSNTNINASKSPKLLNDLSATDITKQEVVSKNLSVNYLTSTPVQQRDNKKPELEMNTSVITPRNESKKEIKTSKERSEVVVSLAPKSSENDTSDEDSEHEINEKSKDKYEFLDSEAEDAGDNYESGDSQDEDEIQYEKDNEILEKGETLTSEEDLSTDSDYEKDSFIVSSAEEDNELLSGSGDDLDMSDNELRMSTKSKKKYDERKKKEQKKASREMYESRHKLDKSGETNSEMSKLKKSNRLRLYSTLLESGEDNNMPPKKNKRMRLESTFETSDAISDAEVPTKNSESVVETDNVEIGYKKKKTKRLSESVCNVSVVNEKEITISENATEETDPLLMKVKPEPKTPRKELDISTVHFTCTEEIEEVQVDENISVIKPNETMDPLHGTTAQENSNRDNDSSMSENEEITKNYNSVLNQLNKGNKHKQVKSGDTSLNLDKKQKKSKEPVIEELNLTIAKKKKRKDESDKPNEKTVKRVFKKLSVNDNSEDSMNLNLLFSDESNDIGKSGDSGNQTGSVDSFIPLKRTEAKTDIRSSIVVAENSQNESVNTKPKKKNKRNSKQTEQIVKEHNSNDGEEIKFFIDTTGTRFDIDKSFKESLNTSEKKKNKNITIKDGGKDDSDSNEAPVEISFKNAKVKNKAKRFSEILEEDENLLTRLLQTPGSEKKKKNKLTESEKLETLGQLYKDESVDMASEENTDMSLSITPGSEKKKKKMSKSHHRDHDSPIQEQDNIVETQANASLSKTPRSEKKKNRLSESETGDNVLTVKTPNISDNAKKKKNFSITRENAQDNDGTFKTVKIQEESKETSKKRKRQSPGKQTNEEATLVPENSSTADEIVGNKKKKRKISGNNEDNNIVSDTKRKERDDDDCIKKSKVVKRNSSDQIHVSRLPVAILNQLNDKPKKEFLEMKKSKLVSTTDFVIEVTKKRKNKPSNFLEESVYLNTDDDIEEKKLNARAKKPKVLPYLPTVCTSYSGFTTNFQVTVLPKKFEFVAQSHETTNFKTAYLENKRMKKLRTYDLYKKRRNAKLTKY